MHKILSVNSAIRLTQFSHGAGCGCKISPQLLDQILHASNKEAQVHPLLMVGNETKDDAAVFDWENGEAVISTTDFFMPIVDDPFDFGRIAATNAISDVYAMGGKPMMAIAILGWPIDKLAPEIAGKVLEGGRAACRAAGIPLAGGHSIDAPEPIFGLAVTGKVKKEHLKQNNQGQVGDLLFLTKSLGVGVLSTAQKRGLLSDADLQQAIEQMATLNAFGEHLGPLPYVHALTDVTGFGLFGHLIEMCEGSDCSASLDYPSLPILPNTKNYLAQACFPGGTKRNLASYGQHIAEPLSEEQAYIGADPQTSGGLLIAIDPKHRAELEALAAEKHQALYAIGQLLPKQEKRLYVQS